MALTEVPIELSSTPGIVDNSTGTAITIDSSNNTNFADNVKAVFGAGSDLQIYHDGFNSNIKESGAGSLLIDATNIYFRNAAGTKDYLDMVDGGAVTIKHNNLAKLATTSTGIDVTGGVTADSLTVDGQFEIFGTTDAFGSTASSAYILKTGSLGTAPFTQTGSLLYQPRTSTTDGRSNHLFYTGDPLALRMNIQPTGDISFYEDTGTTAKLVWKASDERLGIGTASPQQLLHINGGAADTAFQITNSASGSTATDGFSITVENPTPDVVLRNRESSNMRFLTANTERIRISSTGQTQVVGYDAMTLGFPAVAGGASRSGIKPTITGAGDGQLQFLVGGNNVTEATTIGAMIDASGNLLVGGTTAFENGATTINTSGLVYASRSGNKSGHFNIEDSDGEIVNLSKNGSPVGSIGTAVGYLTAGTGDTGLLFNSADDAVQPWNISTNSARDALIDIGRSTHRFKNLYLSGNTQMGGNLDVVGQISSYDNVGGSYGTMNVRALDIVYKSSGGSERMRLDSSGNLLVGTSSSVARIHASISSASLPAVAFENTNTGSSGVGVITTSVPSTANNTNCFHLKSTTQGVASYYLYGNGSSSFTSDERQKKNIVTTRDGYLDDLKNLRVVDYHWNNQEDTEDKNIGLIAQEVEQVFPNLVVEHELEGAGVRKNLKGSDFTFILIKAIQEQQDLIESLTARIAALEGAN